MNAVGIQQDDDAQERIVLWCIYIATSAMVVMAALSGWRMNSKLEKARMERVERLEARMERVERLEARVERLEGK